MAMIDEFLDPDTVRMLCKAFGGRRVTVPAKGAGPAWKRLADALGEDHAGRVVRWFAGETVAVPMAPDERIEDSVKALRNDGVPVSDIAKLVFPQRLSERQIYRICAADKAGRIASNG